MRISRPMAAHAAQVKWWAGVLIATMAGCGGEPRPAADTSTTAAAPPTPAATPATTPATTATPVAASGASGEQLYVRCVACHQANGQGMAPAFPPLAGSEYATHTNPAVPIRIVLHGLQGPITVKGTQYNGVMPPYGTGVEMSDQDVAAVLTHVRQSFGNGASAITPQQVATERAAKRSSTGPATAAELNGLE